VNVICTDGTRFRCDRYELTEKGVKLYSGDTDGASERYESATDEHQIGFVPDAMLQFILPESTTPAGEPVPQPPQHHSAQPPASGTHPAARQHPRR